MTLKTILLVDDSTTNLLSISSVLTKAGFVVQRASNGEQVLALLQYYGPQYAKHEWHSTHPGGSTTKHPPDDANTDPVYRISARQTQ